ncbi:thioredoxin-like fold protein [Pochonia chlamydosporia 170]|uniref:Thioredoxin n=1 Tax=Pochonia chlamydosporia 170 TaxID=1380566 RepID=A0A179G8M9_METCM|nr:thioredoxin-like fold protein [Pochonia chlamydosporia 170]OAQ73529.2 thioredoxin-like fold protein [Pochonia chlamydosporia 170]
MPVVNITSKPQFDELLKSHRFVALQASASWCGPCKAISPMFVKHSDALGVDNTYAFAKFDTDDVPDLAFELGVRSLPTFYFFENGDKTDSNVTGANPPALKKAVEEFSVKAKGDAVSD